MHSPAKDTLFYDGNCPLCSREISLLSRLTKDRVAFQDIHQYQAGGHSLAGEDKNDLASSDHYPDQQAMLKVLHLQRANGHWLKGLDANVAVWNHTAYGPLFLVFKLPVIKQIAGAAYKKWAELRYQKLYNQGKECNSCACEQAEK